MRQAEITRNTAETQITLAVNLDAQTPVDIQNWCWFLRPYVGTFRKSRSYELLVVKANGDLHVDSHHTVEDVGIALGLLREALGEQGGINRYGTSLCRWMRH